MTVRPDVARVWASDPSSQRVDPGEAKYILGWGPEVPTYQVLNYLQNRMDTALLALAERGVYQWGSDVAYKEHAIVWDDTDNTIYIARKDIAKGVTTVPSASKDWDISSAQVSMATILDIESRIDTHIARVDNPHQVTTDQVDTYNRATIDAKIKVNADELQAHEDRKDNPHGVTATQAGGVPQTGGAFTGQVDHTTGKSIYNKGNTPKVASIEAPNGGGMHFNYGSSRLGVDSSGQAYFFDGTSTFNLIDEGQWDDIKIATEVDYAVPEPDLYMPLISDYHIYAGFGECDFTGTAGRSYTDKAGASKSLSTDMAGFGKDGFVGFSNQKLVVPTKDNIKNFSDFTIAITCDVATWALEIAGKVGIGYAFWIDGGAFGGSVPSGIHTLVLKREGNLATAYVDGEVFATKASTSTISADDIWLGHSTGSLNNLRIWGKALTDEQITTL